MNLEKIKRDFSASIVVFLVALPLCLGVSLASGAPLVSGLISGIIGGIIVGLISKSDTSVSGPAAGLTTVVFTSINKLGSFEIFLLAVLIAGIFQILLGMLKIGNLADYIPTNVIKGLLAAIGIILIFKQIPHAIGYDADPEEDFSFFQPDGQNTFSELFLALKYVHLGAIVVSLLSLIVYIGWEKLKLKLRLSISSSIIVILSGTLLNYLFNKKLPSLAIEKEHLVTIPEINNLGYQEFIHFPDPGNLMNPDLWVIGLTIAMVASLETLLNIEAIDKLDPHKRLTPPNRELIAQGFGNIFSGVFGGIPVTSVIVRSSVNIQSGNETKLSAILHGTWMILSIMFFSPVLNMIPLSCLAIILIMTGYKLTNLSLFKQMYGKGWDHFTPFIMTIVAIIFTDLLYGVIIGLAFSIFFILKENYKNPLKTEEFKLHIGDVTQIELSSQVTFLNRAAVKNSLWELPENSKVVVDATNANFIDDDILEIIQDFREVRAPEMGIKMNIIGLKSDYQTSIDNIEFINFLDKKTLEKFNPLDVLQVLKEGNGRFVSGKFSEKFYEKHLEAITDEQNPMAIVLSCIDSRTSPEILFDANLGDLMTIRIAGNVVNQEIIESIELAVYKFGVKLIVVKGHSHCGAILYSIQNIDKEHRGSIDSKIMKSVLQCGCTETDIQKKNPLMIEKITKMNVRNSIQEILEKSQIIHDAVKNREVGLVEAYHEISSGIVYFGKLNE